MCVLNFRSVSIFVWPGGLTQINTQVKLGISSTGCSPYLDFDDKMYDIKYVIFETDYFLKTISLPVRFVWRHQVTHIMPIFQTAFSSVSDVSNKTKNCGKSTSHGTFSRLAAVTLIFWKSKNTFLDKVIGSMSAKFQVCIVVSEWPGGVTNKQTNTYIHTHIQVILRISSTGCSSYVDFDYIN